MPRTSLRACGLSVNVAVHNSTETGYSACIPVARYSVAPVDMVQGHTGIGGGVLMRNKHTYKYEIMYVGYTTTSTSVYSC